MHIDKLNLANLVGKVVDKITEYQTFYTLRKLYQRTNSFEKQMDFAMDIDKLNLPNLVGKVPKIKAWDLQIITKPLLHWKYKKKLFKKPYFNFFLLIIGKWNYFWLG